MEGAKFLDKYNKTNRVVEEGSFLAQEMRNMIIYSRHKLEFARASYFIVKSTADTEGVVEDTEMEGPVDEDSESEDSVDKGGQSEGSVLEEVEWEECTDRYHSERFNWLLECYIELAGLLERAKDKLWLLQ